MSSVQPEPVNPRRPSPESSHCRFAPGPATVDPWHRGRQWGICPLDRGSRSKGCTLPAVPCGIAERAGTWDSREPASVPALLPGRPTALRHLRASVPATKPSDRRETAARTERHWYRIPPGAWAVRSLALACPGNGVAHVLLGDAQLLQVRPDLLYPARPQWLYSRR